MSLFRKGWKFFISAETAFEPAERLLENKFPKLLANIYRIILYNLFRTLIALRILREVDILDKDETLPNRTLVVVREAVKRGNSC